MTDICELIRKEFSHDREFCLYPLRFHDGLVQACTVAYNRAITINLRFFNDKYEFQVWIDTHTDNIIYQPSNRKEDCFWMRDFVLDLFKHNREAALIMLYSIFFKTKRLIYAAHADEAAHEAAYVTYEAADAVEAAAAADYVAYEAAYAVEAVEAAKAADAAKKYIEKALRNLFKFRKELIKND